jgi:hypothetical protein
MLGCVISDEQCSSLCVEMCIAGTVGREKFVSKAFLVMIESSLMVDRSVVRSRSSSTCTIATRSIVL